MPRYDLAVVGAGLGGLTAAAFFSRKNKKVAVLEPSERVGGAVSVHERNGFLFATGPALSFGFERGGVLQEIYAKHGIGYSATVLSPCYQVLLPDRRVNVYAEHAETMEELGREFPDEIQALTRFYRDLKKASERMAKSGLYAYQARHSSARRFMKSYRFSEELKLFFDIQALFFFRQPVQSLSLFSLARLLDSAPLYMHGGFPALAQKMLEVVLQNGGEVSYCEPWPELSSTGKSTAGLLTSRGSLEADAILFNTQQEMQEHALFLAVRDDVIPVGMERELFCLTDYSRPGDFFSLSVSARDDEASAPKGMRALTVSFNDPHRDSFMKETLFDRIETIVPFLRKYTLFAQEHRPEGRSYSFPPGTVFKPVRAAGEPPLVSRTSFKNVYALSDDRGTPVQSIHAGRRFADMLLR